MEEHNLKSMPDGIDLQNGRKPVWILRRPFRTCVYVEQCPPTELQSVVGPWAPGRERYQASVTLQEWKVLSASSPSIRETIYRRGNTLVLDFQEFEIEEDFALAPFFGDEALYVMSRRGIVTPSEFQKGGALKYMPTSVLGHLTILWSVEVLVEVSRLVGENKESFWAEQALSTRAVVGLDPHNFGVFKCGVAESWVTWGLVMSGTFFVGKPIRVVSGPKNTFAAYWVTVWLGEDLVQVFPATVSCGCSLEGEESVALGQSFEVRLHEDIPMRYPRMKVGKHYSYAQPREGWGSLPAWAATALRNWQLPDGPVDLYQWLVKHLLLARDTPLPWEFRPF
jgi:hypothetical protein